MICYLRGNFAVKTPAQVVVDVNGVGYELQISLHTYSAIANMDEGQLHTYLHITENAQTLYGFYEMSEKELFLQLISVSGIGTSTARMMLSGMRPDEIIRAITQSNVKQLEAIKGIGKKTAERLIVELKDKLSKQAGTIAALTGTSTSVTNIENDALQALLSLGIARPAAEQALRKVLRVESDDINLEALIKLALKNI